VSVKNERERRKCQGFQELQVIGNHSPEEIAATCLFLVSDDGGFITGQTIHANGGVAYQEEAL
jgi:NAD(P)-dependent dehydrogenase (short-subunit alcohol dehydrogenase family)